MDKPQKLGRRDFFKKVSLCAASAPMVACSRKAPKSESAGMTMRINPKTGEKVSLLGFGCMRWPTVDGRSAREGGAAQIDQRAVNELVDYAIAHGVNYFDTSPVYCQGKSEEVTGIALSRHPREKYFVATKLSNFDRVTWSRERSLKMYNNSFKALRVDYIDYMLLHYVGLNYAGGGGMDVLNSRYIDNGVLDFLLSERESGRIRNLGFSYHGDVRVFDYLLSRHDFYKWDFVQIQLNYLDWKHAKQVNERNTNAEYLYDELDKRKIPAVVMEPLLGGRLSNIPHTLVPEFKRRSPDSSVASWAFRFAGSFPRVLTVLSGMVKIEHLSDNIKTYSPLKGLSPEEFAFLEKTAETMLSFSTIPCNDCKYCMPCPYGLDIPSIILHYNKCVNERAVPESRRDEKYPRCRRAYLIGYDRSVPKLRQASRCTGCDQCSPHCPQNIDIPRELRRIDSYVKNLKRGAVLMGDVKAKFEGGKYSCVVGNGELYAFNRPGIADLLDTYSVRKKLLKGALVADRVVGRAAASILVKGGISEVYAKIISNSALKMLKSAKIGVSYDTVVPYIKNNNGTGVCPMEDACKNAETPEECLKILLEKFSKSGRNR